MRQTLLRIFIILLLPAIAKAQSGTIVWPAACPANNCPGTYTDPNGVQVTVTSFYGTGTGAPVNLTQMQGSTAGALNIAISSSAAAATQGLGIAMNYGTNYTDAQNGNLVRIVFNNAIEGTNFRIYDLTSPTLSCTGYGATAGIYNDMIQVTGTDINGNTVNATITELARGSYNNGAYDTANAPSYITADQFSISGNQAYVTGGYVNTNGTTNVTTNPGSNAVSMDISASFSVPVTEIRILYKNYQGADAYLGYYKTTSNCPAAINGSNFAMGDLNAQTIMVGNIGYSAIIVRLGGAVMKDPNGMTGGVNGTSAAGVTVNLYDAAGTTLLATTTTDTSGNYFFDVHTATGYVVGVDLPQGYQHVSSTDSTPANGLTNITVGSIAMTGVNFGIDQPPIAVNDSLNGQPAGAAATVANILGNDTDPGGVMLSPDSITLMAPAAGTGIITDAQGNITGFTLPGEGTWTLNADGSVTFTPQAGFTGDPAPVSYSITDNAGLTSDIALIRIDFNNPPVAQSDITTTSGANPVIIPVINNDSDPDNNLDTASITVFSVPAHGITAADPANGTITYTPNTGFTGTDTFIYRICDKGMPALCDTALVLITVNTVLPVKLSSFKAFAAPGCTVSLAWTTSMERHLSCFEIETGTDGVFFSKTGAVRAQGSGRYTYLHPGGTEGINYFRLKLTDVDGSYTYSDIISTRLYCDPSRNISVYPTVSRNKITVNGLRSGEIVSLYDARGRKLMQTRSRDQGAELNLQQVMPGSYTVMIITISGERISHKIIKE